MSESTTAQSPLPAIPDGKQVSFWTDTLIRPGYVRRGYCEESAGLYPELRFVYSPMLPEEVSQFMQGLAQVSDERVATQKVATLVSERLVGWSLNDEISYAHCSCLPRVLLQKLQNIIYGMFPTDIDPLWSSEDTEDAQAHPFDLMGKS